MVRIPFVPMPLEKALRFARMFYASGSAIAKTRPGLKLALYQAGLDIDPRQFAAVAVFSSIFFGTMMFSVALGIGIVTGALDIFVSIFVGLGFGGFVFMYLLTWPNLAGKRKVKELERDILNALQHMLIEIKSGVPLFNAMLGISDGYGKVSEEFKKIVREINAGTQETQALDKASERNPSLYFRRAIWQLVNALKAGSDVGRALEAIVDNLMKDQLVAIRKYGQELNPYTMMYMMFAVILPSLGITFLIIISSFSGIIIPNLIFPLIIFVLVIFNFFYIGLIKTKRPSIEV